MYILEFVRLMTKYWGGKKNPLLMSQGPVEEKKIPSPDRDNADDDERHYHDGGDFNSTIVSGVPILCFRMAR